MLAAALAAVAGGRAYTGTSTPPTSWLGLLAPAGYRPGGQWIFGLLLFLGIAGLAAAWLWALAVHRRGALTERQVWRIGAAWCLPLAVGPPLVSKDVYSYAAQGILERNGFDVYRTSVSVLARIGGIDSRALEAVDPRWRHALSPYGPLATAIERAAAALTAGNPVGIVIVLRVLAVLSLVVVARMAAELAAPHRATGLVVILLNPLVLVHAVSGVHFEAPMCALLLAGLVAAKRGRWHWAIALICAAGAIKPPLLAVLPALFVMHAASRSIRGGAPGRLRPVLIDVLTAAAAFGALTLLVPDGLGWIRNLATTAGGDPTSSLTGTLGALIKSVLPETAHTYVNAATKLAGVIAAVGVVAFVSVTARRRPLPATAGYALLAVALLAPISYPWYVLWGAVCLLPIARSTTLDCLVALCIFESVSSVPGAPGVLTGTLKIIVLAAAIGVVSVRFRNRARDACGTARSAPRSQVVETGGRYGPHRPTARARNSTPNKK
jgi:hypothetical protein